MFEKQLIRSSQRNILQKEAVMSEEIQKEQLPEDVPRSVIGLDPKKIDTVHATEFGRGWKLYTVEVGASQDNNGMPESAFFCDYSGKECAGYTRIDIGVVRDENRQPVRAVAMVGDTATFDESEYGGKNFTGLGLGTRRLLAADKYCREKIHAPLSSGRIVDDSARSLWERLVKEGIAEKTGREYSGEYRFKKTV